MKPKLNHLSVYTTWGSCAIDCNGVKLEISLNEEQVRQIQDFVYEHLGEILIKAFQEKIHATILDSEKGFDMNPFDKPLSLPSAESNQSEEPAF